MTGGGVAPCRVVIAEDSLLLREGIATMLAQRGFEIVAQVENGEDLLRKVAGHRPDAVVVDIRMPPTHTDEGLRAAEALAGRQPDVGVLVLSQHVESAYAVRLLERGVAGRGYLLKDQLEDVDALADAVRRVAAGDVVVDPAIVRRLLDRRREVSPLDDLADRERATLALMAEGRSNRAIAELLFVSEKTVESYVHAIFEKLGLQRSPADHRRVLAVLTYLRA